MATTQRFVIFLLFLLLVFPAMSTKRLRLSPDLIYSDRIGSQEEPMEEGDEGSDKKKKKRKKKNADGSGDEDDDAARYDDVTETERNGEKSVS